MRKCRAIILVKERDQVGSAEKTGIIDEGCIVTHGLNKVICAFTTQTSAPLTRMDCLSLIICFVIEDGIPTLARN